MKRCYVLRSSARRLNAAPKAAKEDALALNVVMVYEDPLMRYWATELWDRVSNLVGHSGICRTAWGISDLGHPDHFAKAVQEAARAHVLLLALRDAGVLPPNLGKWIQAWTPQRKGAGGVLAALIGMPPTPNAWAGQAYRYLEAVARRAGLDYLPRERKLPEELPVLVPGKMIPAANRVITARAA